MYYILPLATNSSLNLSLKVIFVFEANISFNAKFIFLNTELHSLSLNVQPLSDTKTVMLLRALHVYVIIKSRLYFNWF